MKNLKRALSVLFIISLLMISINIQNISAAGFTDVKTNDWYYNYVNRLIALKITSGIGNNQYGPNNSVTRAEFVTFLCKANGLPQMEGYTYTDTQNHWSSKWISTAVAANIIEQDTEFYPNKAITRQEAVEMLCRSIGLQQSTVTTSPYTDVKSDMGYSNKAYEEYLMQGSVSNGQRYFYPNSDIKRSEVAAVIVNLVDYKADIKTYKETKKSEMDYAAWSDSVKSISALLLNNAEGLYKSSVYESNRYLRKETEYLKNWGAKYGMTEDEFADEMVRVGTMYANISANANYKDINTYESDLKAILDTNGINISLKKKVSHVKNNTIVAQGSFITSKGMLVFADWGNPILRGTMKCKYSSPTSTNVLNSDVVGSTGKHLELGVWYEQDFEIRFLPENGGLKVTSMYSVSDIRISK